MIEEIEMMDGPPRDRQPGGGGAFVPPDQLVIGDLETLRVLADPLRMRIMEAFARDADLPQTVKRVAGTLGESITKLYYHVNLLEERGLLLMVESRVVSGIIEKRYQPVARSITVNRTVLGGSTDAGVTDALGAAIGALLDSLREDVVGGIREGRILTGPDVPAHQRAVIARTVGRLSPARAETFHERLGQLLMEFDRIDDVGPDAQPYAMSIAFYPSRRQAEEDEA
jgi:hypothetical protein